MAFSIERELIRHRSLLASLVWREVRGRYAGSAMGLLWTVVHPLMMLAIYTIVLSVIVGARPVKVYEGSDTVNYAIFLCCGLFPFNCAVEALMAACGAILANGSLIRRVKFPVAILPVTSIAVSFVTFLIAMILFVIFLACLPAPAAGGARPFPGWIVLALPLVMVFQFLCLLGPAYLLATLHVFFRDTAQVVTVVAQLMFWATPVIYTREMLVEKFAWLRGWFAVNPMASLVEIYRYVLIRHDGPTPAPWGGALYLAALGVASWLAGRALFKASRARMADEV